MKRTWKLQRTYGLGILSQQWKMSAGKEHGKRNGHWSYPGFFISGCATRWIVLGRGLKSDQYHFEGH